MGYSALLRSGHHGQVMLKSGGGTKMKVTGQNKQTFSLGQNGKIDKRDKKNLTPGQNIKETERDKKNMGIKNQK